MPSQSAPSEGRPLLTIAIPTYNRSELLIELLNCLREQIRGQPGVRLLVSDNASTDGTQKVIEEELLRGTQLDYVRNQNNIGPDANFLQCFERATGKYVWIISDDDLLRPGTVATVVSYLERDEFDAMHSAMRDLHRLGRYRRRAWSRQRRAIRRFMEIQLGAAMTQSDMRVQQSHATGESKSMADAQALLSFANSRPSKRYA